MSASDCIDNFTICGFGGSELPPPQAVSAVNNNNTEIFFMASFLGWETS
jgi:hypothetical protein